MDPERVTAPIDAGSYGLRMAAEVVDRADVGPDRLATLLSADVGHTDSEVVYRENKLALHRYEPAERRNETPIFVVYALINRPYILDLQPDRSVVRRLLEAGFEVYLVDWGEPSRLDRALGLDDYVTRYLDNCVDEACETAGVGEVHLLGYCMGGTMATMYAATHGDRVRTLSLMTTPVVFDDTGGILERWANHYDPEATVEALGNLPAELLALEFSLTEPVENYVTKYLRLYENLEDEAFVANFARMERWIWDGVDLAGEAYREFVDDIYRDNKLVNGEYHLGDERVDPADIEVPVQQIVGQYDHIVPPSSSEPLNDVVSSDDERIVAFPAGHIGVSVSSAAHEDLWPDVCEWLAERDAGTSSGAGTGRRDGAAGGAATDAATGEAADATDENGTAVQTIRGIGPTYAGRLGEAGIETVADLREYDADRLAEIAETSPSRAADWLERAG